MWVEAGFAPDAFWHQTPRHFQVIMRAVRKRLEGEEDARVRAAWMTAAFTGSTQSKRGLKPLSHYLKKKAKAQTPVEMLAVMRQFQARGAPMTIRKIERDS